MTQAILDTLFSIAMVIAFIMGLSLMLAIAVTLTKGGRHGKDD